MGCGGKRNGQGELSVFPALNRQGTARSGTLTLGRGLPSPPVSLRSAEGMRLSPGHAVSSARSGAGPRPAAVAPARARAVNGSRSHLRGRGEVCGTGIGAFFRWGRNCAARRAAGWSPRAPGPWCPPGWRAAPGERSHSANIPALRRCPGPRSRSPDEGVGGCTSHRLFWPFCFTGGFRCRDVRDVTWGFLPPRWS